MKVMLAVTWTRLASSFIYIDEKGLLFFSTVGGHDSAIAVGQRVWVHGKERLPGAVGRKAIHFSSRRISKEAKIQRPLD